MPLPSSKYSLDSILTFGKYKGMSVRDVIDTDVEYVLWALENINTFDLDSDADEYFESSREYHDDEDWRLWD